MEYTLTDKNKKLLMELSDKAGINLNNSYFNVFIENCLIKELEKVTKEN